MYIVISEYIKRTFLFRVFSRNQDTGKNIFIRRYPFNGIRALSRKRGFVCEVFFKEIRWGILIVANAIYALQ